MEKTVAIIGGNGLVGGYLTRIFKGSQTYKKVVPTTHSIQKEGFYSLDITQPAQLEEFFLNHRPDVVIFAAAMTHVDRCEKERELCLKSNVEAVKDTVRFLKKLGKPFQLVFFSTEYIFDGEKGPYRENDPANPLSVYGMSKWKAEEFIRGEVEDYLIARVTGVFGLEESGKNFFYTLGRHIVQKKTLKVPSDQISTPTYAGFIARAVRSLVESGKKGTFHVAAKNRIGRSEFAFAIARRFGWDAQWIQPVLTAELGQKAKRPLNAGLVPSVIPGIETMPTVEENLEKFYLEWKKWRYHEQRSEQKCSSERN